MLYIWLQNDIMKAVLSTCPEVSHLASEEDENIIKVGAGEGRYVVVFDPLDGSRNIDAAIPTGQDKSAVAELNSSTVTCANRWVVKSMNNRV